MTQQELSILESAVFSTSIPYRDSTAFQRALLFVKAKDPKRYESLLLIEAEEAGINY